MSIASLEVSVVNGVLWNILHAEVVTMKVLSLLKTNRYRLWSRFFLCILCFAAGCTFTLSFLNPIACLNMKLDPVVITEKLSNPNKPEKVVSKTLVILILSAPDNILRRHALRRTWLTLVDQYLIKYYFVIGSKDLDDGLERRLLTEAGQYSDLLILPEVQEGYNLLTSKLLSSLIWVDKNVAFDFLLKVDDDSFVDIRQLFRELMRKADSKRLYWGYFHGHAQIKHTGKWKEMNWNLCDHYLPYARGGGYVLARQLVLFLAQNADLLK